MNKSDADYTWIRHGGIGDVLMTMNLVENFRKKHGEDVKIAYAVHPGIAEIVGDLLLVQGFSHILDSKEGWFGKQIPLIGYPIPLRKELYPNTELGNHPHEPMKRHAIEYFAEELEVEPDFDSFFMKMPNRIIEGDYVTIHPKAGWSQYKNWNYENWNLVAWNLKRKGIKVIQIGSEGDPILANAAGSIKTNDGHYKGRIQFNTCLAAIAHAKLHLGVDSWTNHATNIQWEGKGRTKGIILWGSSQHTGTGYPKTNINILKGLPCQPCFREDPKISSYPLNRCPHPEDQTYENPKHECMEKIDPKEVYDTIIKAYEENQ